MSPRQGECSGATPGSRTNFFGCTFVSHFSAFRIPISRAPACAAESPKLSLPGAAPGRLANFQRGRGRQVMHLPCKQAHMGAVPIDSTISSRGTRLKHRGRSHKPFQAGVIPAPATNLGRCPGCRSVKPVSKTTVGSDDWSVTSTSHHFSDP